MKLNFRQGIVRARTTAQGTPDFLSLNQSSGAIQINITNPTLLITLAHKDTNFLIEEVATAINGWGPFSWSSAWGSQPGTPIYHLYWDVNLATGEVTRGYTHSAPVVSSTNPLALLKVVGTHWFDLSANVMKVSDGTFWVPVCRVFAGTYSPNVQSISHYQFGSQVGITSDIDEHVAGFIVLGNDQKAIRTADGELMTSETDVIIKQGGYSSPVSLEALSTDVISSEPIPAFHCVTVTSLGKIGLASSDDNELRAVGIVDEDVPMGSATKIITNGILFNEQWNWDLSEGKELYCGSTGELVQKSGSTTGQRIAFIITAQSIMVDLDEIGSGNGSGGGVTGTGVIFNNLIGPGAGMWTGPYNTNPHLVSPDALVGNNGDFYVAKDDLVSSPNYGNEYLFGPKLNNTWGAGIKLNSSNSAGGGGLTTIYNNLNGDGVGKWNGNVALNPETILPVNSLGVDGDYYIGISTAFENGSLVETPYLFGPKDGGVWSTGFRMKGEVGPTGATGPQGPQGLQGIAGNNGATGPQGPQGLQGLQGPQGVAGSQGAVGPTGPQGTPGTNGSVGPTGPQGASGPQGIPGNTGPTGPQGLQGPTGPAGANGTGLNNRGAWVSGSTYNQNDYVFSEDSGGNNSMWVFQGTDGYVSSTSPKDDLANWIEFQAPKGDTGPTGPQGLQGLQGPTGPQGPQGIQGLQGEVGPTGATGLQGDAGPTGPQGIQGVPGNTGPQGLQGLQGTQGEVGPTGPQGLLGPTGPTGPAGTGGPAYTIYNNINGPGAGLWTGVTQSIPGDYAPSNAVGSDGDFYLGRIDVVGPNQGAEYLFGPKNNGAWPVPGSLINGIGGTGGSGTGYWIQNSNNVGVNNGIIYNNSVGNDVVVSPGRVIAGRSSYGALSDTWNASYSDSPFEEDDGSGPEKTSFSVGLQVANYDDTFPDNYILDPTSVSSLTPTYIMGTNNVSVYPRIKFESASLASFKMANGTALPQVVHLSSSLDYDFDMIEMKTSLFTFNEIGNGTTGLDYIVKNITYSGQTGSYDGRYHVSFRNTSKLSTVNWGTGALALKGTGYQVGDTITIGAGFGTGSTPLGYCITPATLQVLTISAGGAIETTSIITTGEWAENPVLLNVSGGSGTGARFNLNSSKFEAHGNQAWVIRYLTDAQNDYSNLNILALGYARPGETYNFVPPVAGGTMSIPLTDVLCIEDSIVVDRAALEAAGYEAGDRIEVGGENCIRPGLIQLDIESINQVDTMVCKLLNSGLWSAEPSGSVELIGGSGTGGTVTCNFIKNLTAATGYFFTFALVNKIGTNQFILSDFKVNGNVGSQKIYTFGLVEDNNPNTQNVFVPTISSFNISATGTISNTPNWTKKYDYVYDDTLGTALSFYYDRIPLIASELYVNKAGSFAYFVCADTSPYRSIDTLIFVKVSTVDGSFISGHKFNLSTLHESTQSYTWGSISKIVIFDAEASEANNFFHVGVEFSDTIDDGNTWQTQTAVIKYNTVSNTIDWSNVLGSVDGIERYADNSPYNYQIHSRSLKNNFLVSGNCFNGRVYVVTTIDGSNEDPVIDTTITVTSIDETDFESVDTMSYGFRRGSSGAVIFGTNGKSFIINNGYGNPHMYLQMFASDKEGSLSPIIFSILLKTNNNIPLDSIDGAGGAWLMKTEMTDSTPENPFGLVENKLMGGIFGYMSDYNHIAIAYSELHPDSSQYVSKLLKFSENDVVGPVLFDTGSLEKVTFVTGPNNLESVTGASVRPAFTGPTEMDNETTNGFWAWELFTTNIGEI